ncbi:MATE family efflux transporter, partial [Metallosphaera sp.]|uniref:MATE family efflux transporter n=1 Tax=Metallosphaera sp. TaxID=2020860 RepID=UPI0031714ED3
MGLVEDRDKISTGVTYQYIYTIILIFEGFLFYLFLVHFFSTEIVGAIALLNAILALFSIIFSLGLGTGVQHFISYYIGQNDVKAVKQIVIKMSMIAVLISIIAFAFIWIT